ncbi:MAG: alanine racemase [Clostridiales Family XIII bacterium]|jgi:alanine racemase|nr:alanine racemase [Clostridiales Family XIII bacterium]
MFSKTLRWAWTEVDLRRLAFNMRTVKEKAKGSCVIAVVKADAYGHGAVPVSKVLLENGADVLAAGTLQEALILREAGFTCPVLILGLTPNDCCDTLTEYDLIPVTASYENARAIAKAAETAGVRKEVFVAVDTGMGRIGVPPDESGAAETARIHDLPHLRIKGIFGHFATADEADKRYAFEQTRRFNAFCERLTRLGVDPGMRTHANSAAVMELPEALFDAVRPGIILYGCYPAARMQTADFPLRPVMSVKAKITYLKRVPKGTPVSYGRMFITQRESLIGTLSLGYADGLPRALTGKGRAVLREAYAPIVGAICMDQCMIDVTDIPGAAPGDEAIVMGAQGDACVSAEEIAEKTGAISYEVLCGFGQRLPKVYAEG